MSELSVSRRQLLAALAGVGVGAAAGCASPNDAAPARSTTTRRASPSTTAAQRAAPGKPGDRPFPDRAPGSDSIPQIEHIVIYMQENHSFDNYYGMLGRGDGFTMRGGTPANTNPGLDGAPVGLFHMPSATDLMVSASQTWDGTLRSMNDGRMDGFVTAAAGEIGSMGYWTGDDLPFYYSLASTFPLCDRWFGSAPCQTLPNRRFLQAATSMGIVSTDIGEVLATPIAPNGIIWERLNDLGITWADYAIDLADIMLFPGFYAEHKDRIRTFPQFLDDAAKGNLPQVCIISPGQKVYSEENPWDIQLGESYSASIINAVMAGPGWEKTALLMTYDEHGGYYDHVPPPKAIEPDTIAPRIAATDVQRGFDIYGPRVPGHIISPYAKADYVSHVVHDHTSILRFIETKFNLDFMTFRDANADDLSDCFDFSTMAFREPPELAPPALPGGASKLTPEVPPVPQPVLA